MEGPSLNGRRTMSKFQHVATKAAIGAMTLLVAASVSAAQEARQSQTRNPAAAQTSNTAAAAAKPNVAQASKRTDLAKVPQPSEAGDRRHRLILQVNTNDAAAMNLALNNAANVAQYYKDLGEN